jgi:raffinose/stachyose/melibiose transport system substrate-binding protein
MRKTKVVAFLLSMVLVLSMVGCGNDGKSESKSDEEKQVEIEFVQVKREAAESYAKVIEAFEKKNPDIKINQNVIPDAQEVLMSRASSGNLPDMMNHWPTDAQYVQFANEGLLLDLSEKEYIKNIDDLYIEEMKMGENLYMAPYNMNFMGLYYNADKFKEAGFEKPNTWEELIDIARQIKEKGEVAFVLPNKDAWTVSQLWSNIEGKDTGSHKEVYEKMSSGEEDFTTIPTYKSSLEKMIELLDYSDVDSLALGYDQAVNDFANGKGWMFIQGSWALPSLLNANPDLNVAFCVLPNDNGDMKAVMSPDSGFCVRGSITEEPEKMEAIDRFIAFALSKEGAQIYTDNDKSPSCVTGVSFEVPQFKEFFDYVEVNGSVLDATPLPTGFEDTKRGKIQNVLIDKDVEGFLEEMSADYKEAASAN